MCQTVRHWSQPLIVVGVGVEAEGGATVMIGGMVAGDKRDAGRDYGVKENAVIVDIFVGWP